MKEKAGPALKSAILLLSTYKTVILVCQELRESNGPKLSEKFITLFNGACQIESDIVDSYLERVFDSMGLTRDPSLRLICAKAVLKYLIGDIDIIQAITLTLEFHQEYLAGPEAFRRNYPTERE
jgi:hypothetical protein